MSVCDFPLYTNLVQKMESKTLTSLTQDEHTELCEKINKNMDQEGCELLYVIIRYYSILEDKLSKEELPYKPKINKTGLKFDLSSLPIRLVHMIKDFTDMHYEKLEEEKAREIKNNLL